MDELLNRLSSEKIIAVDTEFHRETTYYPVLALVQIATRDITACIDPLAFNAIKQLRQCMLNQKITKIFHSCSQDIEVLYYYLGKRLPAIYDTQIANALLSEDHQLGYAALVDKELDVQLDKSQTRTDWLRRPLTDKQIQYAGDDVHYLYQLHEILDKRLLEQGRKAWFDEDSNRIHDTTSFEVDYRHLWRRVKGANKLRRDTLAIVQTIAEWRENMAKQKNKTRRKILKDEAVIKLALSPPASEQQIPFSPFSEAEKSCLLEQINHAQLLPEDQWPDNRFTLLDGQQKSLLKELQKIINDTAAELEIASAMLTSRKELEKIILQHSRNTSLDSSHFNILRGWRLRIAGQQLLEKLG